MRNITVLADNLENLLRTAQPQWRLRRLKKVLSRSVHRRGRKTSVRQALFHLFGLDSGQGSAPFNMLADGLEPGTDFCIHADPVCLYVDIARVFITRWGASGLSADDMTELAAGLKKHFQSEGMQLHSPGTDRWYLSMAGDAQAGFPPPEQALGRDIGELLPAGPNTEFWKTRLNECQMILHRSAVNEQLTSRGEPAVNSLWFWGAGRLPEKPVRTLPLAVQGNDSLLHGLAQWAGVPVVDSLEQLLALSGQTDGLCVYSGSTDNAGEGLLQLQQFMSPVLDALKLGNIKKFTLLGSQNTFELSRNDWRAFWRHRSFSELAGDT